MVFKTVWCLVDEKNNIKEAFLLCSMKLLTHFENPYSNPCRRPYSGNFDPGKQKFIQETACDPKKSYRKPTVKVSLDVFSLQPMSGRRWRTLTSYYEGNSGKGFSEQFQNYSSK
jgi:hypothetical protein